MIRVSSRSRCLVMRQELMAVAGVDRLPLVGCNIMEPEPYHTMRVNTKRAMERNSSARNSMQVARIFIMSMCRPLCTSPNTTCPLNNSVVCECYHKLVSAFSPQSESHGEHNLRLLCVKDLKPLAIVSIESGDLVQGLLTLGLETANIAALLVG